MRFHLFNIALMIAVTVLLTWLGVRRPPAPSRAVTAIPHAEAYSPPVAQNVDWIIPSVQGRTFNDAVDLALSKDFTSRDAGIALTPRRAAP